MVDLDLVGGPVDPAASGVIDVVGIAQAAIVAGGGGEGRGGSRCFGGCGDARARLAVAGGEEGVVGALDRSVSGGEFAGIEVAVFVQVGPEVEAGEFAAAELAVGVGVQRGELGGGEALVIGIEEDGGLVGYRRGIVGSRIDGFVEGANGDAPRVRAWAHAGVVGGLRGDGGLREPEVSRPGGEVVVPVGADLSII